MPEKATLHRVDKDRREGKAPSTQAGEFVREEIEHVREGKHGARSSRQAIAIGLSKARRAGVGLPPPRDGATSRRTRRRAVRDARAGSRAVSTRRSRATLRALTREGRAAGSRAVSTRRSRATLRALTREGRAAGSRDALSRQGRKAAARRSKRSRSRAATRAAATRKRGGR